MWVYGALVLLAACACAEKNVTVVMLQLALEEEHTLHVDNTLEYILRFVPNEEQSQFPSRVWVRATGGDTQRPLLLTARQRAGATTWQLPYYSSQTLLYELERTLCPDDSIDHQPSDDLCAGEGAEGAEGPAGAFTLHAASSCAQRVALVLRVDPVRQWRASTALAVHLAVTQAAPRVLYYQFSEEESSVRLVVSSEDELCATVAVQGYTCPIAETLADIGTATLRMTVQRSGGAQLSKERYPRGFYIIVVVDDNDAACSGEQRADSDWLWEAAVWPADGARDDPPPPRTKRLTIQMNESLSRAQYLAGTLATLGLFLSFYAGFGAVVAAQRAPYCRRLLAQKPEAGDLSQLEGGADTAAARRRRRDSDATFDSSDNSDESDSDDGDAATAATATTSAASPPPPAPTATTPPPPGVTPSTPPADLGPGPGPGGPAAREVREPGPNGRVSTINHENAITRADILERDDTQRVQESGGAPREGAGEGAARPFGLPARLRVAALARRRGRVLRARSDRYLTTLYTVALFYALPVLQFVAAFQMILNLWGSLDLCYYNFLCAHPLGALSDFNHVYSNLGYLLLGALFMLQLKRRRMRRKRHPKDEEYGIPQHYGLLSSLGAGMMMVALLSASYHVCPNRLNFQFDTAFMYVLAVLSMVKIYQSRHPDINARAHATFGALAVLIALVVWGVLAGGPLFWSVFTVLHVFTFLLLSLRIYYVGQFRLEKQSLAETARALRGARPLYSARLAALLVANIVNWAFALYGLIVQSSDIASHLLGVLLCNALLYMVFYLSMKLLHGERLRWYAWVHLGCAAATWAPGLYLFASGSTDWSSTPALSRHQNHECRVLAFYDSHDLWHLLSAAALYFTFNAMLTWDDGLSAVKRTDIAVF